MRIQKVQQVANAMNKSEATTQPSSSMHPPEEKVTPNVIHDLKKYHASLMVSTTMAKSFHYCITGMGFFTIHPKLGEYWEELDELIDEIAELIVIMKGVPVLTMKEAIEISHIKEYPFSGNISIKQAMTLIHQTFETLTTMAWDVACTLDEMGNIGNSGILGEHYNYFTKTNWMIRAYLKD